MFQIHTAPSLDLPELAPYRTMRLQMDHRRQGIFVAEGEKVVRRLLESSFPVVSLLLEEQWLPSFQDALDRRSEMIPVYVIDRSHLEKLTGYPLFQGILAIGKIPQQKPIAQLLSNFKRPYCLVAIEAITNAINLGVIVRNCASFGVHGLIVGETSGSPFLRRAVRNSMGGILQLPICEVTSLVETLEFLKTQNIRCIAAHPRPENKILCKSNLTSDCCIVFGSEGYGISQEVLSICDESITIPMAEDVDSLNVGSASAVFLYEVQRQRLSTGISH
jgi:tRNA G18 (ribose-2'-O)-methylase SpoU